MNHGFIFPRFSFWKYAKGKMAGCQKWWFTHFALAIIYLALILSEKNTLRFGLMPLILMAYEITLKNQCVKVCWWLSGKLRSHYHLQPLLHSKFEIHCCSMSMVIERLFSMNLWIRTPPPLLSFVFYGGLMLTEKSC